MNPNIAPAGTLSHEARQRMLGSLGEPWLLSGWRDAVFLHFTVEPEHLQPFVPFPLDLHDGMACVSCVAFTMRRMRPRLGGEWLMKPIATHEFLNVRTYVMTGGERGIYFLAEWLPNKLSVLLGPAVFGLPYRHGRLAYEHDQLHALQGSVEDSASSAALRYTARAEPGAEPAEAEAGSLDEFLLERYTAFTWWHGLKRCFRVWHPAWNAQAVHAHLLDTSLLSRTGAWAAHATFTHAHFARGFDNVWMSRPHLSLHSTRLN